MAGEVNGARGGRQVEAVEITTRSGTQRRIDCDLVAMSGGWSPTLHLTSHRGHRPRWDDERSIFVPDRLPAGMTVAGAANGDMTLGEAIVTGFRQGLAAAAACGFAGTLPALPRVPEESTRRVPLWKVTRAHGKCFVDFQNDVTADDIELAEREGFRSVEHAKRYTTLGMATDQGKTSNVTGIALLARHRSSTIAATGTTTFRPPYTPVAMGALAGHHKGMDFRPTRLYAFAPLGQRTGWQVQGKSVPGCGPSGLHDPGKTTGSFPPAAKRPPCAPRSACATCPRSARSTCRDPMHSSSSSACTPTTSRRWPWAAHATASCCAKTASCSTTAPWRGLPRTVT